MSQGENYTTLSRFIKILKDVPTGANIQISLKDCTYWKYDFESEYKWFRSAVPEDGEWMAINFKEGLSPVADVLKFCENLVNGKPSKGCAIVLFGGNYVKPGLIYALEKSSTFTAADLKSLNPWRRFQLITETLNSRCFETGKDEALRLLSSCQINPKVRIATIGWNRWYDSIDYPMLLDPKISTLFRPTLHPNVFELLCNVTEFEMLCDPTGFLVKKYANPTPTTTTEEVD
jgi:hypothetical protein